MHTDLDVLDIKRNCGTILVLWLKLELCDQPYRLKQVCLAIVRNLASTLWEQLVELSDALLLCGKITYKVQVLRLVVDSKVLDDEDLVQRQSCLFFLCTIEKLNLPVLICGINLQLAESDTHREQVVTKLCIVGLYAHMQVLDLNLKVINSAGAHACKHARLFLNHFFRFLESSKTWSTNFIDTYDHFIEQRLCECIEELFAFLLT